MQDVFERIRAKCVLDGRIDRHNLKIFSEIIADVEKEFYRCSTVGENVEKTNYKFEIIKGDEFMDFAESREEAWEKIKIFEKYDKEFGIYKPNQFHIEEN